MEVIPALYILKGNIVALYKGSLEQKDTYRKAPIDFAKQYERDGAPKLFLVDLDKSVHGEDTNSSVFKAIRKAVSIPLICAGGVRSIDDIKACIDRGMDQIVLGVSAEEVYSDALAQFGPEKIIVGIKAKGDEVQTDMERQFPLRVIDFAEKLPKLGVKQVLFKDIWKESTQIGPNYDEPDRILSMLPLEVYYSGGIGEIKHLKTLKEIGVKGAIIGKALYEGELRGTDIYDSFL